MLLSKTLSPENVGEACSSPLEWVWLLHLRNKETPQTSAAEEIVMNRCLMTGFGGKGEGRLEEDWGSCLSRACVSGVAGEKPSLLAP